MRPPLNSVYIKGDWINRNLSDALLLLGCSRQYTHSIKMADWWPLTMVAAIEILQYQVAEFCQRNHIRRMALFGSVIRNDFTPESDVDVLVEFEPGRTPGLAFFAMQRELTELLGRQVDLNTAQWLSPYFRPEVLDEAEEVYVSP